MLLIPDAYTNDWYGWVTNQSAHILLGIVIALITRRVWPAVVMAVLFEFLQWSTDIVDSVTDVSFTFAGALFYKIASDAILWTAIAAFAVGAFQRRK